MAEHSDAVPAPNENTNNDRLITGATVQFDVVEHPLELDLDLDFELDFGEDEEHEEDGNTSDISEEGEEGETQAVEEEGYRFQFEGEMDPLSFVEEEDASGLQPYERFEMIENHYEVLAAKKRPALQQSTSEKPAKRLRQEEIIGANFDEIMETMNRSMRRRSRKAKRRGRRKGSRNKLNPFVTRKLGDATLHYAHGRFEEAIKLLHEVIRVAPNLPDPYHTLALIYTAMNDERRATNLYLIAALLSPRNASLWKLLVSRSIEQGDKMQATYCLNKAIIADPEDIGLRFLRALLYVELREYQKAADSYEQIARLRPDNVEVLEKATQMRELEGFHITSQLPRITKISSYKY